MSENVNARGTSSTLAKLMLETMSSQIEQKFLLKARTCGGIVAVRDVRPRRNRLQQLVQQLRLSGACRKSGVRYIIERARQQRGR